MHALCASSIDRVGQDWKDSGLSGDEISLSAWSNLQCHVLKFDDCRNGRIEVQERIRQTRTSWPN